MVSYHTLSLMSSQLQGLQSQGIYAAWIGPLTGGSNFHSADLKDAPNLPSLLSPIPKYSVTKIKQELMTVQDPVKLIVLGKAHETFDRTTKFRECYNFLESLKDDLPCTPMMALNAMLGDH